MALHVIIAKIGNELSSILKTSVTFVTVIRSGEVYSNPRTRIPSAG